MKFFFPLKVIKVVLPLLFRLSCKVGRHFAFVGFWGVLFLLLGHQLLWAQLRTDLSPKAASPINQETLPRVKTNDPYGVHSRHLIYFEDTLASCLLKYTASPDFNSKDPVSLNDLGYIY